MATFKRQGPGIKVLEKALKISGMKTSVGWFPGAKYQDGTPVAYVAAIQEYGTTFTHPGGTKYIIGEDGKAVFVKNSYQGKVAGVTKPHQIVIPPRSFMRTTIAEKENEWAKLARSGAKAMVAGNASLKMVMEGLGLAASGDIKKKISEINSPALKAGTIENRKRKLAKGKKVGALTKPLVETSLMISSLTSTVETS
jgi:hypothetical protein